MKVASTDNAGTLSTLYQKWRQAADSKQCDKVRLKRNGAAFRSALVDPVDGYILETYSHELSSSHGFHHGYYLPYEAQDKFARGDAIIVWVHDMHDMYFDLRHASFACAARINALACTIREQIEEI